MIAERIRSRIVEEVTRMMQFVNGVPGLGHLKEERILNEVRVEKDVDGLNPLHIGNLAKRGREPLFIPCTPKVGIEHFIRYGHPLLRHHATVSVVRAFTKNHEEITKDADIVVSAAGIPNLVRGSWLKRGSIVIDIGTHSIEGIQAKNTTSWGMFML
ncbi:hypothetical protein MLD38_012259 [Melastoma candidum]|uniref:Uncharacterized protein n=1 Tax=Melastoma candidum TaxID=119954 RepID=A0ACB9R5T8_9MYRT|nr:hypothetical protein MLD38_012259 [Melastoma candidum]